MSVLTFIQPNRLDRNYTHIQQVAAAIHRMNNEPGMAENPAWRDLCDYFDRRWPGNGWELPF